MGGGPMTTAVEVALSGPLRSLATGTSAGALASRVQTEVSELADRVGLARDVRVEVTSSDARRPLRVIVNGMAAPYPPDLLWQLWMEPPDGWLGQDEAEGSIARDCVTAHCGPGECAPNDVARLVVSIVRDRPALLVDDEQAAYVGRGSDTNGVDHSVLRRVLESLLDLGVAPCPTELVLDVLASNENRLEDSVEAAFALLQGRQIEIGVSASYRSVLTGTERGEPEHVSHSGMDPSSPQFFELAEERLLVEWGIVPPDIVWTTAHDVPDGRVVVKVNDRRSLALRGLDEGDCVILPADPSARALADGDVKRTILNPANADFKLMVVESARAAQLDATVPTATPAGFAALLVYRELVANAHRLVGTEQTLYLLQDLERRAGELVHLVLRHFTVAEVTQVLRALVLERIPPRLLPVILERFARLVVHPLRPDARAEFVRRGLSTYVYHRFLSEGEGRTLFELSPEIEDGLAAPDALYAERVRDAFWSTLRAHGVPPVRAALVVRKAPRDAVYRVLAPELPEVAVLRGSELDSGSGLVLKPLEPTAQIALEATAL